MGMLIVASMMLAAQLATETGAALDPSTEVRISSRDRFYHADDCNQLNNLDRRVQPLRDAEAQGYKPHADCLPRIEAAARRVAAARADAAEKDRLLEAWTQCASRSLPRYGRLKTGDLRGQPEKGSSGDAPLLPSTATLGADGMIIESFGGVIPFRRGELVTTEAMTTAQPGRFTVTSALRHNITRGRGAFEHQSAEHVSVDVLLPFGGQGDCTAAQRAWGQVLTPATEAVALRQLKDNPSGVLVDEVTQGMSPAEVEGILGPPERKAALTGKTIYFYPRMKVTFVAGKVTNVE